MKLARISLVVFTLLVARTSAAETPTAAPLLEACGSHSNCTLVLSNCEVAVVHSRSKSMPDSTSCDGAARKKLEKFEAKCLRGRCRVVPKGQKNPLRELDSSSSSTAATAVPELAEDEE